MSMPLVYKKGESLYILERERATDHCLEQLLSHKVVKQNLSLINVLLNKTS